MTLPKRTPKNLSPKLSKDLKQVPAKKATAKSKKLATPAPISISVQKRKQFKSVVDLLKRKLSDQPQAPIPNDLKPMLASITSEPFNDEEWQFEIKWDGYRALAYLNDGQVQLRSRNNLSFDTKYIPVVDALKQWPINAVIDGEIIILNEDGKADFKALQDWQQVKKGNLVYYVYDILWLDGISLINLPLEERQQILRQLMPDAGNIRFSDCIEAYGVDFYNIAKENGLEGIIAKHKDSLYQTGYRTKSWLKIKIEQRHEAAICGYTKNRDTDRLFSSLLLARYAGGRLTYIGQVGTGFNAAMQEEIMQKMKPLLSKTPSLEGVPRLGKETVWIKPHLVCEVKYTELTPEGVMRHPSFQGLRDDKTIADINNENPDHEEITPAKKSNEKSKKASSKKEDDTLIDRKKEQALVSVNDHELKLTNLNKVFWIKENITKGDLINYYHQVAPYIMPYMKDRPQSLNRFPNGVHGDSFYQKNMAGKVDKWIKTFKRFSESTGEDKDFMI